VGTRSFYLGTLFNSEYIDGEFEDKYTNIGFIIPMGKDIGICIQHDGQNILDAFTFEYSRHYNRFIQKIVPQIGILLVHRIDILGEINKVRFKLYPSDFFIVTYYY
jgi:hypothetical protein